MGESQRFFSSFKFPQWSFGVFVPSKRIPLYCNVKKRYCPCFLLVATIRSSLSSSYRFWVFWFCSLIDLAIWCVSSGSNARKSFVVFFLFCIPVRFGDHFFRLVVHWWDSFLYFVDLLNQSFHCCWVAILFPTFFVKARFFCFMFGLPSLSFINEFENYFLLFAPYWVYGSKIFLSNRCVFYPIFVNWARAKTIWFALNMNFIHQIVTNLPQIAPGKVTTSKRSKFEVFLEKQFFFEKKTSKNFSKSLNVANFS